MKIFISHSHKDEQAAGALVQFLLSALKLEDSDVLATSVPGHMLPIGVYIGEQLKKDMGLAPALIALVTARSLSASWVIFELGAAWALDKKIFPILGPSVKPKNLPGPLPNLSSLQFDDKNVAIRASDLVRHLAEYLNLDQKTGGKMQAALTAFLSALGACANTLEPGLSPQSETGRLLNSEFSYSDAERVIREHCEAEWPEDFTMRKYCVDKQMKALSTLRMEMPSDIPESAFTTIRRKAETEWPTDYAMRLYRQQQEIDSYRQLHSNGRAAGDGRQAQAHLDSERNQPVQDKSAKKQDDMVLFAIWQLDNEKYYQYGYTVQEIAEYTKLQVSNCQHSLDMLLGAKYIKKQRVHGGKNATCYSLMKEGRDYLVGAGIAA